MQSIELSRLKQDREATNLNLKAQHRLMIATLILALVAVVAIITSIVIAIHSKPIILRVYPKS